MHDLISMGLNERCPLCMGRTVYFENFVTVTFQHLPHVEETGLPKKISRYLSHVRKTDARINGIVGSIHEAASLACGKKSSPRDVVRFPVMQEFPFQRPSPYTIGSYVISAGV